MPNEVQNLLPSVSPTLFEDGACELTFDGQTTASIGYGDINTTATFASKIQTELEALSNIGSGNVSVAWVTDRAVVTFQGTLANTDVPEITVSSNTLKAKADTVSLEVDQEGGQVSIGGGFTDGNDTDTAAVQTVTFSPTPTSGDWSFDGNTVSYPSSPSRSGWTTSGDYSGGFTITKDDFASGQSAASVSNASLQPDQPEIVTVSATDGATEGGIRLVDGLGIGVDWGPGATAAEVETSLESGGNPLACSVAGDTGGPWTITTDAHQNYAFSVQEGDTPLRKSVTITPSTQTEGGASGITADAGIGRVAIGGVAPTVSKSTVAPIALVDLLGIAPAVNRSYSAGQGLIDIAAVAPTTASAAPLGPAAVDVVAVAPTTAKSASAGIGLLDVSGITPTTSKAASAGIGLVDILGITVASGGISAAAGIGLVEIAGVTPATAKTASAGQGIVDIAAITPASSKQASAGVGLVDVSGVSPTTSKTAPAGLGLVDILGVAPTTSIAVSAGVGLVEILGIGPGAAKSASLAVGLVAIGGAIPSVEIAGLFALCGTPSIGPYFAGSPTVANYFDGDGSIIPFLEGAPSIVAFYAGDGSIDPYYQGKGQVNSCNC